MSDFQKRLKIVKRKGKFKTSELARWFARPYTTVDSWLKRGCEPNGSGRDEALQTLQRLERKVA